MRGPIRTSRLRRRRAPSEAKLDEALARTERVRTWVAALPDEEPSLAWRSRLTTELRRVAPVSSKRRRLGWSALGLAAATVLAAWLIVRVPAELTGPSRGNPVETGWHGQWEALIVEAHRDATLIATIGDGPTVYEERARTDEGVFQWSEWEVESL